VPETHLEQTKLALFSAGAGRIGNYEHCAWQCRGQGQFRPMEGSSPYLGEKDRLETVVEYKVELVCEDGVVREALRALKAAHPYEEPAYDIYRLEAF
jgi:hypothetical protein